MLLSNDALAEPIKIPGLDYLEVNINGKGFERSLVKKLSVWSFMYDQIPSLFLLLIAIDRFYPILNWFRSWSFLCNHLTLR
jgi:hypothetical protein